MSGDFAPAPELWIGNEPVATAQSFPVRNPFQGEEVGRAAVAGAAEIARALDGAARRKPLPAPIARAEILERAAARYRGEKEAAARLITTEAGIAVKQARHEVDRAVAGLLAAAHQARRLATEDQAAPYAIPGEAPAAALLVVPEPVDLAVAITPFNHPLNQVIHKVAPAVAAGSPLVVKPSEKAPFSAFHLARVLAECGLPPHFVNVVTGSPPAPLVAALVRHPAVERVSFTGSVEVGKAIARTLAAEGKELARFIPELGGNAALVVMDDADPAAAARIALGAFDNAGQRCTSIQRILLHEAVAEEFLARFTELAEALVAGDPFSPSTDLGPLIDEAAAARVERTVEAALASGARLLLGHRRQGALYPPTVVDRVPPGAELAEREVFGPVAAVMRIGSLEQAIALVRERPAGRYRLAGAIATASRETAMTYAAAVRLGQLSWNGPPGYRTESAPFGGFGDSGNGEKEGIVEATRGLLNLRAFYTHPLPGTA